MHKTPVCEADLNHFDYITSLITMYIILRHKGLPGFNYDNNKDMDIL